MAHIAAQALPQPDFALIAQHHTNLAAEMSKCANISAFDGG
jgi:hypothetical protein